MKKETTFVWQEEQQTTFDNLKNQLSLSTVMVFYNLTSDTKLIVVCMLTGSASATNYEYLQF